jgi:hypothetical protein
VRSSERNAKANISSFQAVMKAKNAVTARPGRLSGRTTRRNVPKGLRPSMRAASSSSYGMVSK